MKKILLILFLLDTFILANINVVVSILPEKTFLKAIGGDRVDITLMVLPGNSPHTYEPKPSQMKAVSQASLYFAIGVEFEKVWLPKFRDLNPAMQVIDLSEGIERLPMAAGHHHGNEDHHSDKRSMDPHIWTSPRNVEKIAHRIYETLSRADSTHADYYRKNLEHFLQKIAHTDTEIRTILSSHPKRTKFMVFHPSWGYFAKAYGLTQIPVEVEGKEPKPRELVAIINEARKEHISAIFTQPEFSDHSVRVIASELHIPVIKVTPLAPDWSENLIRIAKAIAGVR
jgi:zinc transport system substrate-binding protein